MLDQYTEVAEALYNLPLDKLNDMLEELSNAESILNAKYDITGTAAEKNSILAERNANAAAVKDANVAAAETAAKNLQTAMKAIDKTTDSALKGLSKAQQKEVVQAVKAGEVIDYIKYGNSLSDKGKKAIIQYNAALKANEEASYNAEKASYEYTAALRDTAQEMFNNIRTEWESIMSVNGFEQDMLNEYISQAEAKGYMLSGDFYNALIESEQKNLKQLEQEKADLLSTLESEMRAGNIKAGTNEWREMCAAIDDVTLSIEKSTTALIEYENEIRQLKWDAFDTIQERIEDITSEADFLIDLLSRNDDLFDDNGKLNSNGEAVAGLHAANYNTNMALADRYAEEIKALDAEIAADPYDNDLLERRQELLEAQRDAIKAAEDEKDALKDLIEDGIDAQIDAMSDLIEKYKDALDSQKDLYDYQKKVKDSAKEIAALQKQLSSLAGDTSEENKATIQKLKVSLEEAQQDLEETEYDKYISDQKEMLDTLQLDFENFMNERLDNIDGLLADIIQTVNTDSGKIWSTIQKEASSVGYTVTDAMQSIWSNADDVITMYGSNFLNEMTTVNQAIRDIGDQISAAIANAAQFASEQISSITSATETTSGYSGSDSAPADSGSNESDEASEGNLTSAETKAKLKQVKKIINAAPVKTASAYNSRSHSNLSELS